MTNFDEYYEYYLTLHRHPLTKMFHVVGNLATVFYLFTVATLSMASIYFLAGLLAVPFIVYPFAWFSHLFIEKNKPAAWSRPIWAKMCDWVMIGELVTGNLKLDTRGEANDEK